MPAEIEHLYIHFPFCISKCGYCSFYSIAHDERKAEIYKRTLLKELQFYQQDYNLKLTTLYFGGGTPSLMSSGLIRKITKSFVDLKEATIEVNPADVNIQKARSWTESGINRISMGCQSMNNRELEFLGRRHDKATVIEAFETLRKAGFENISLDFIYGLPGQKIESVIMSLKELVELEPEHFSCYCLSLEPDCPLGYRIPDLPDDDTLSEMYFRILDFLGNAGYDHYEISSFCRPGMESKHNLAYWKQKHYLGCGPSAAGYLPGFRYQNHSDLRIWQNSIEDSEYFSNKDLMDHEKEILDYIMLSLRLREGIDLQKFEFRFKDSFQKKYEKVLAKYLLAQLIEIENGKLRLTKKALFISNEVIGSFFI